MPAQDGIQPEEDDFNELYESIKEYINEEGLSKNLNVTKQGNDQILLCVAASVFFDSGSADINTNAEPLLDRISDMLVKYEKSIKMVRIEGHKVFFWSNENDEPIHVHVGMGKPSSNATKFG